MATISTQHAIYLGGRGQNGGMVLCGGESDPDYKETASQTYEAGSPLCRDASNGTVAISSETTDQIDRLHSMAIKPATGTTGALAYGRKVLPGDKFACNFFSNNSAAATALSRVGDIVGLRLSGSKMIADVLPTNGTPSQTELYGKIVGLYTKANGYPCDDVVGDTGGRVIVEIPDQPALQA